MTTKLLVEKTQTAPVKQGNRWRAVLAVPGQGSSGFYSEEVLKEYGPSALAPGAKAFIDHDPKRPARDMIGVYPDGAVYEDGVGLVGDLEVFPHWKEFVEAVGPHAGLSIYMMGEADEDGNVTSLIPDRQNGVDLVSYPGLIGSGLAEKLYESAKASADAENNGTATADRHNKESKENSPMEIEDLATKVDALVEAVSALTGVITPLAENFKPVVKDSDEVDVAAAVESAYDKAVEAALPKELRRVVIEAAKNGEDVDAAITAQKAIVDAVRTTLEEAAEAVGRFGGASTDNHDYRVTGLKVV